MKEIVMAVAAFGTWKSPITAEKLSSGSIALGQIMLEAGNAYWIESRPNEGGRLTLICRDRSGQEKELTPQPYSVRTRVHEYGGGAYCVFDGNVYFSNFSDQRLYVIEPG